jgi:glutaredoxin-related protein
MMQNLPVTQRTKDGKNICVRFDDVRKGLDIISGNFRILFKNHQKWRAIPKIWIVKIVMGLMMITAHIAYELIGVASLVINVFDCQDLMTIVENITVSVGKTN